MARKKKGEATATVTESKPASETVAEASKRKLSAKEKARASMGLPPIVKAEKKQRPKSEPGAIVPRKSKYNIVLIKGQDPGWASSRIVHWMGKNGWEFEQARKALGKLCPATKDGISDENLKARLAVGKGETRSRPAPLTKEEIVVLKKAAGIK